jgi:hypothetical protein
MPDTISVASKAHMPIQIGDLPPDTDKPGLVAEAPASAVLNGGNHVDAVNGVGITHDVDAGMFHRWLDRMKEIGSPLAHLVSEASDEMQSTFKSFGFEPGLAALANDDENTEKAEEGSLVTEPAPVKSSDMAATTVIPPGLENVPPDQIPTDVLPHDETEPKPAS